MGKKVRKDQHIQHTPIPTPLPPQIKMKTYKLQRRTQPLHHRHYHG